MSKRPTPPTTTQPVPLTTPDPQRRYRDMLFKEAKNYPALSLALREP